MLRESKLAAGESDRSLYYNLEPELRLDDLTAVEATRWNVLPLGLAGALTPPVGVETGKAEL